MRLIELESNYEKWKIEYQEIAKYLVNHLLMAMEIRHIGSTNVKNLKARPLIDIRICLSNFNELIIFEEKAKELGYKLISNQNNRFCFFNESSDFYKHILYVGFKTDEDYQLDEKICQKLNEDIFLVEKFSSLKEKAATNIKVDEYIERKNNFFNELIVDCGFIKPREYEVIRPDYCNNILNIASSIKKVYNVEYQYPSMQVVDEIIAGGHFKHYVLMILDGMGSNILKNNLKEGDFLNRYLVANISSVYPSTTSAAIPTCMSGLAPMESGWIGWENYLSEVDKSVIFFMNCDYFTGKPLDIDVLKDVLPYKKFYDQFPGCNEEVQPSFAVNGCHDFEEFKDRIISITNKHEKSFTYAYWDNPDSTMHEFGAYDAKSVASLSMINHYLEGMVENLADDTCLIISADHGHTDVLPIEIRKFTYLMNMLCREPGNEGRCTTFKVKKENYEEFPVIFNKYFSKYFKLYQAQSFLESDFLGLYKYSVLKERVIDFLGDYVAVAINKYYFDYRYTSDFVFKSHHAGMTSDEMIVPLIIYTK